jgi:hypothetical protein
LNQILIFWGDPNLNFFQSAISNPKKCGTYHNLNKTALFTAQKTSEPADCSKEQPRLSALNSKIGRVKIEIVQTLFSQENTLPNCMKNRTPHETSGIGRWAARWVRKI